MTSVIRSIPISDLALEHPFWMNPRLFTGLDDDDLDEFGKDIKARGILVQPKVQKVKGANGEIIDLVIDGQRRVRAALGVLPKNAKIEVIDRTAEPIELDWKISDEIMREVLSMATNREGLSSYELSEVSLRMRNRDVSLADIGAAIGKSESWVSKILKARLAATPKLMLAWRKGEVTDEQFKDMATVADPDKQTAAVAEVKEARKSGDKTEARLRTKEIKETVKAETKKSKAKPATINSTNSHAPREQRELFKEEPPAPPKKVAPSKLVLEQMVELAERRPPTNEYVKGLIDGVRYALDQTAINDFGKSWMQYVSRVGGQSLPKKVKAKKAVRKPGGKARRGVKAKGKKGRR